MRWRKNPLFLVAIFPLVAALSVIALLLYEFFMLNEPSNQSKTPSIISKVLHPSTPTPTVPFSYVIPQKLHVFQSFNNCGPATLSMALSYVSIDKSQDELGRILRPYQIPGGDNDDKSVTLHEVAKQAEKYGLHAYLRPNGDIEKMKKFIAQDIPVVTRTLLKADEDIGHYRVIRGYDDALGIIIQDDSLQGKDLTYAYKDFDALWQTFNYEYLVIVDNTKKEIAEAILGEELDEHKAWENALTRINKQIKNESNNSNLLFARSRIYYYLKDFAKSIKDFNAVESSLSFRTLWYQIEPLLAVYETGDYERVLDTSQRILNNQNRAYSELYILRGKVFERQGNKTRANEEFQKALQYNANLDEARQLTS